MTISREEEQPQVQHHLPHGSDSEDRETEEDTNPACLVPEKQQQLEMEKPQKPRSRSNLTPSLSSSNGPVLKFSGNGHSSDEEGEGNQNNQKSVPPYCRPKCPPGEMEFMVGSAEGLRASIVSNDSNGERDDLHRSVAEFIREHTWGDETINGAPAEEGAVQMVLFNLPSAISVYGVEDEVVPSWNRLSPTLIDDGMLIAGTILCDNGWVVCIHTVEQRREVEDAASNAGLESSRTFTLASTKPIYRHLRQQKEKVYCLLASVFHRGGLQRPKPYHIQAGEMCHDECSLSRDLLIDNVDKKNWVRMADGKPWRGGAQRSTNIWRFLILAFSKYGDTVVDLSAGTGGFVKMASDLGRHALGIESDVAIVEGVLKPLKEFD